MATKTFAGTAKRSILAIGLGSAVLAAPLFASVATTTAGAFAARPDNVTISAEDHDDRERDWHETYDVPVYVPHVDNSVHQSR